VAAQAAKLTYKFPVQTIIHHPSNNSIIASLNANEWLKMGDEKMKKQKNAIWSDVAANFYIDFLQSTLELFTKKSP